MTRTYDPQLKAEATDEEMLAFAQFILDRFLGHEITEDLLINALRDFLRDKKDGWTKQTWSKK